jgi:hypothetical protein
MLPPHRDQRLVDLEEKGGWQKPTERPSAHSRPAGLPPKPTGGQEAGQGAGGQNPAQQTSQSSNESS